MTDCRDDPLYTIRASWDTVRDTEAQMNANLAAGVLSRIPQLPEIRDLTSNLLLVFAFSVLEDALVRLRDAGRFAEPTRGLGRLMKASRDTLPWVDYKLVSSGREALNAFAHRREYSKHAAVAKYVDAISAELSAWGQLDSDSRPNYTISVTPTS